MRILDLELFTADVSGTAAFYGDTLAFPILVHSPTLVRIQVGQAVLSFHLIKTPSQPFYHLAFTVPWSLVAAGAEWTARRTSLLPVAATQTIIDFPAWQARAFYFADNNGNLLEGIGRAALPDSAENPFTAHSFLGINEVGLPVANVLESCEAWRTAYGIPFFKRGPKQADFAALGDDEGLFVVSAINRGWLPTRRPAEQHGLTVRFEQRGGLHTLIVA